MISSTIAVLMLATATPSFDCAKATGVERTVCAEPRLATLDARLAKLYEQSVRTAPTEAAATRQAQRAWLRKRDEACAKAKTPAPCLDGYYRSRISELRGQQSRRDETLGHPPTNGTYADFIGRWRVVGVTDADDAGEITNFATDDPRYMNLELSAGAHEVRWLNGTKDNGATTDVCAAPSFTPRKAAKPLPAGWKAVTLACKSGQYWTEFPAALTLKAQDLAEMEWDDGALLHLKRVPADAKTPPPHSEPPPPLPPGEDAHHAMATDKAFFLALQSAVRRHDREWFAKQGSIQVNRQGGGSYAYGPDEIREAYDWIITPDVERAVLAQSAADLWKNDRGVMIGDGAVWFDQTWDGKRWAYTILAINQGV